ncbi:caspase family protein [Nostoc favosum]|uniref:Caspase family protein n=1 Tax=Nostoc favosum CHAB5714 TaxID=2780399 RepID=A0ABS8IHR2_9NOSO|nr:caspase family protein [Nostoc favosum]MCC5603800.1 caspase family protein [Nostoc favosum CHAB5714]
MIKRRHFIQFATSTVFTAAISQLYIIRQSQQYSKTLAQNTSRKLALLVGINDYTNNISSLKGCINDVRLQRELLTHRFGFNEKDILTLTDAQATRQGILEAFEQHLIKQAKPGDVVVFHFSGHGSLVSDQERDTSDGLNGTLVPHDASLPANGGVVQDIMGHTLFLLMYALSTENVTVVLDSCYSGGSKRGNFAVRSRDGGSDFLPSPAELEVQRKWLAKTGLSQAEFVRKRRKNVAKGIVISAAKRNQLALDGRFNDFNAGAFTYSLTQQIWQQFGNEPLSRTFINIHQNTKQVVWNQGSGYQEPEIEFNLKQNSNPSLYFSPVVTTIPAEAVVTDAKGSQVDLWLGGIPSQSLEAFNEKAILTIVNAKGEGQGLVQIQSRQGLNAKGKLLKTAPIQTKLEKGMLLQERIRTIPRDLTLKIGFDNISLDSDAIAQATQALQAITRIEPLPLGQKEVQYIFGRMTKAKYHELQKKREANLPAEGSFGLFSPTLDGIIPNSFGKADETITEAVTRLQSKLNLLLATKVVKHTLGNSNSSQINLSATMVIADNNQVISQISTTRSLKKNTGTLNQPIANKPINISDSGIPKLRLKMNIVFQIKNNESIQLYVSVLAIDSNGEISVPLEQSGNTLVEPGKQISIPEPNDKFYITITEPLGFSEALIIASSAPLRDSLEILQTLAATRELADKRGFITGVTGEEFLNLTNSLLDDLDRSTRSESYAEDIQLPPDIRGIDTKKLAVMSIPFEVVV